MGNGAGAYYNGQYLQEIYPPIYQYQNSMQINVY